MNDRRLIINADDYGICREVNSAIEDLVSAGILGGVSVIANGNSFHQAADFLSRHPEAGAGAHLNAVEGRPLSTSTEVGILTGNDGLFVGLPALLKRWVFRPHAVSRAVEIEWDAQIRRLIDAKIRLVHVDSHQHLHAFPSFFDSAVRLCREYGIFALRIPNEKIRDRSRLSGAMALRSSLRLSRLMGSTSGLHGADYFLGFHRAGRYALNSLIEDIASIPAGLTELAVHPSRENDVPYAHYRGEEERNALLDPAFRKKLGELGIKLVSWEESYSKEGGTRNTLN